MYDVAIIGAGPAGATLARIIGKDYKVLVIDKRPLDNPSQDIFPTKCCGGLLAPDAQKMMAVLGLELPQSVLLGPQLFAVRAIDLQHSLERFYQRFYINMDREKFDRWMVSLIPGSVELRTNCTFRSFEKPDNCFNLKFKERGGKERTEQAKILIGADGALSLLRRQAFPDYPLPRRYIAIQEWFPVEETLPYYSSIFDPEITDFYAWTIPKEHYLLVGAALLPDNQAGPKFELLKHKLGRYGFTLGNKVRREGAQIFRPQSIKSIFTGKNDIALVGEAAGWISPSSSEGLSYSLKSALCLAQSLLQGTERFEEHYQKSTKEIRRNIRIKNLKSSAMYNPWIRKTVMLSGIQSLTVLNK
ncbi:MAG: FAD-binding protein [Bacillota bacterium]